MTDKRIILDLETKKTFDDVGGKNQIHKLGISVVGIYDYASQSYECYVEKDFGKLQNRLIDCSLLIGFNHVYFDMPVLQPYLSIQTQQIPMFDIMLDVQKRIGHRVGLDSIATATLGTGKIGSGLDAIRYYNEGRWDELKAYCLKDVEVTKNVYEYGLKNKKIFYSSRFGQGKKELKVDWKEFDKKNAEAAIQQNPPTQAQYKLF